MQFYATTHLAQFLALQNTSSLPDSQQAATAGACRRRPLGFGPGPGPQPRPWSARRHVWFRTSGQAPPHRRWQLPP
jgi:hypothetical protein